MLEAVQAALDLGADINAVDNNGETAMHARRLQEPAKVVKLLAAKGARIDVWNRNDKFGWTPLAIAVGYVSATSSPRLKLEATFVKVMIAPARPGQNGSRDNPAYPSGPLPAGVEEPEVDRR